MPVIYDKQVLYIISVSAFLAIMMFSVGIIYLVRFREQKKKLLSRTQFVDGGDYTLGGDNSGAEKSQKFGLRIFSGIGKRMLPTNVDDLSALRYKFLRAGLRNPHMPAVFWGVKIMLALILPTLFFLFRIAALKVLNPTVLMGAVTFLALLGFYLPELWLQLKTQARKDQIAKGVPDALDLLVVCVEAGMGLDAAIQRMAQEMALHNQELSEEFKLVNLELGAGKSRADAFRNLSRRTNLEDISSLTTTLIQTDRFGTSIAQALRVYADTFRTRRYQRAEEIAAKLPVKLIVPLGLFIFPALFVAILGPAAIRIYQTLILK